MKNWLMYDVVSGEEFIVEAKNKKEALAIGNRYFEDARISCEITDEEADYLGLDTYQKARYKHMGARAEYKKVARTKYVGQCKGGLCQVEVVNTKKNANKKIQK